MTHKNKRDIDRAWWQKTPWAFRSTKNAVICVAVMAVIAVYVFGGLDTMMVKVGLPGHIYNCYTNTLNGSISCCGPLSPTNNSPFCSGIGVVR
jgi:hypothetical protein